MADTAHLTSVDQFDQGLLARFQATLGPWLAPVGEGTAPLGAHWCLFPPLAPTGSLGPDGHPPRLHPIPEAEFPRRMWVGGELTLLQPFPTGTPITRHSSLRPIEAREGKGGPFLLTGLDHRYSVAGDIIATERQDIVYRPAPAGPVGPAPEQARAPIPPADFRLDLETPPALLFRYSALTFNAHRIHIDLPYATAVEGHEGLLVHGPLQATILLNLMARSSGRPLRHIRTRAVAPLIAGRGLVATVRRTGQALTGAIHDSNGRQAFQAEAES